MVSIHNILSIAKYESKTLTRSYFFRIFAVLVLLILLGFNAGGISFGDSKNMWLLKSLPANIPYANLLLLNVAQAIIAIFLAADFLKRDKKLDTTETVYMRPMSNTEYVLGKTWGNLKVFILLNLVVLLIALIFNLSAGVGVDWSAYPIYFFLISVPTLIFIMGLSFLLMSILKNQALTFVLLLGYIIGTLVVFKNKFYYLFDYMAFNIPLARSQEVGFANLQTVLTHRSIYLLLGIGFIFFTIFLLKRLPQSKKGTYFTLVLGVLFVLSAVWLGAGYVNNILHNESQQKQMIALNNQYVTAPRLDVSKHHIQLKQLENGYRATSEIAGKPNKKGKILVFALNSGLKVQEVIQNNKKLKFERKKHLLLVHFPQLFTVSDTIQLSIKYSGTVSENICYPDVDLKTKMERRSNFIFDIDKRFTFNENNYLLVTPETYWYPVAGVTYSTTDAAWYHKDFIHFQLTVEPLNGLVPVSQGKRDSLQQKYRFTPEQPLTQLTLAIGNYERKQLVADSTLFNVWYFKGHDYFTKSLPELKDTLSKVIADRLRTFENEKHLDYCFPRMNLVEVPIQFTVFPRIWTAEQEVTQPEMVLLPEKLATLNGSFDWKKRKEWYGRWSRHKRTDEEWQIEVFDEFLRNFTREKGESKWDRKKGGEVNITSTLNPYYQFAQLFSYNYNLSSTELPIMNRILEAYINNRNAKNNSNWVRNRNGISKEEKVNMMLQKYAFAELLSDKKHKEYVRDVIQLKADVLFGKLKVEIGAEKFDKFLNQLLKEYRFRNLDFNLFNKKLKVKFNISLTNYLHQWFNEKEVPQFLFSSPKVVKVKDGEEMRVRTHLKITNFSTTEGVVKLTFDTRERRRRGRRRGGQSADSSVEKLLVLKPNETKELYVMLDDSPRSIWINTLISKNLPSKVRYDFKKVEKSRKAKPIESIKTVDKPVVLVNRNEIIVDNEDSNFSVEGRSPEGLLQKWMFKDDLNKKEDFKYKGFRLWRVPVNWTLTTHTGFFGRFVRSAYYLRAGNGDKKAIWKIPVKKPGYYEVQYYVYKNRNFGWDKNLKGVYNFSIFHDGTEEEQALTLRNCEDGWATLGTYYFGSGDARVELNNESDSNIVIADAVKLVRLDN